MKLIDQTLQEFINDVDSSQPAPGGGSVSALSAVMGVSLLRMVGHITVDRKAFIKRDEAQQKAFITAWEQLYEIKAQLLPLIDEDTEAFNQIMAAYKRPKATKEESEKRSEAIELATIHAIEVPLRVAKLSLSALQVVEPLKQYGNKNALSDVGVGVLQLQAAITGALMNVNINLSGLSNKALQEQFTTELQDVLHQATTMSDTFVEDILPQR